jgi:transposase InsO family protein
VELGITYLAAAILGRFYRLYLVMDIYSRKIVAWEVHETETAKQAAEFTPAGRKG